MDGCHVRCWFDHPDFDIKTGQVVRWANFPPGIQTLNVLRRAKDLRTFVTRVAGGKVYVTL